MSFMDRSLCFLHRFCPSWTSLLAHRFSSDQSTKLCTTILDFPWCFLGKVLCLMQQHTLQPGQWCSAAVQLGSQQVTKMLTIYWQYLGKSMWLCGWHLHWTSCSQPLATGVCSSCMGSASVEWSLEMSIYCGPYIGCQIVVTGFPLSHKERLEHWAHGDTRHWDSGWIIRW